MKDSSSITAEGVALIRAIESRRPEGERICYDTCAKHLVRPWVSVLLGALIKSGLAQRSAPGQWSSTSPAPATSTTTCSNVSGKACSNWSSWAPDSTPGTTAFRPSMASVKVFKVDHPATQRVKLERLRKVYGKRPANVTYVPVDFDRESPADSLYSRGFDHKLKTLFIWEGVTFYLTAQAVDDTLTFIARNKGSNVIFDYTYTSVIDGTYFRPEVGSMKRSSKYTGEGLVYGIQEGKIGEFLEKRGFENVVNATGDDLQQMYFHGATRRGRSLLFTASYTRRSS